MTLSEKRVNQLLIYLYDGDGCILNSITAMVFVLILMVMIRQYLSVINEL